MRKVLGDHQIQPMKTKFRLFSMKDKSNVHPVRTELQIVQRLSVNQSEEVVGPNLPRFLRT